MMFKFVFASFACLSLSTFLCIMTVVAGVYGIMATIAEQFMITVGIRTGLFATEADGRGRNPMTATAAKRPHDGGQFYRLLSDIYSFHLERTANALYDWVSDSIDIESSYGQTQTWSASYGNAKGDTTSVVLIKVCGSDEDCKEEEYSAKDLGLTYEQLAFLDVMFGDEPFPIEIFDYKIGNEIIGKYYYFGEYEFNGKKISIYHPTAFMRRVLATADGLDYSGIEKAYYQFKYGRLTSPFGPRYFLGKWQQHAGVDRAVPLNTPVHARFSGRVIGIGHHTVYGGYVIISNGDMIYMTSHLDLRGVTLKVGDRVDGPQGGNPNSGTYIGKISMTGVTTGPHRHDELLIRTPYGWMHVNPCQVIDVCETK
jgi:murein DD-endopeptidase MepM/ murein hydrolase activator NlpD